MQLKKLRRNYNEDEDKSRPGDANAPGRTSTGSGKTTTSSHVGEPSPKGNDKPEVPGILPTATPIASSEDKREPIDNIEEGELKL